VPHPLRLLSGDLAVGTTAPGPCRFCTENSEHRSGPHPGGYSFNSRARIPISLSPRPERFTTSMSCAAIVGASFRASATACALSSAGRIPSVRASLTTASSAAASSCETYSARPSRAAPRAPAQSTHNPTPPHRMRQRNLPILILQHIRKRALQHPRRSAAWKRAACSPSAVPRPPASTPISRTLRSGMNS
jgi:hypothetical protein